MAMLPVLSLAFVLVCGILCVRSSVAASPPEVSSPAPAPAPEYSISLTPASVPAPSPAESIALSPAIIGDVSPPSPSPSPSAIAPPGHFSLPPTPAGAPQMPSDVTPDRNDSDSGMSGGKKVGIAFGVVSSACLVGLAAKVYKKRQENIRRAQFGYYDNDDDRLL
ncbi:PREDICTED: cyclin-dependent kinase inhibitor 1C-like [Ipomoea nil]|uniref:cyclin-dependent kinase inhibitor 1C-like n=1 Tax=Ipomoea nil TaxID=35883 RepID=UPI00090188AB|nr:PREDICTED: cyclin-dependent kinase inhibitor 1C-like [Ipomoea nil]